MEKLLAAVESFRAVSGNFVERWRSISEKLRALIPVAGLSVLTFPNDIVTCFPNSNRSRIEFRCRHDPDVSRRFAWNFEGLDDYLSRYATQDPSAAALIRGRGEPLRLSQVVAEADRPSNAFTGEFLPHWNLRHVLAAVPAIDEANRVGIALYRSQGEPDFSAREESLLRLLIPQLGEASRQALLAERMARGEAGQRALVVFGEDDALELGGAEAILAAFPERPSPRDFLYEGRRQLKRSPGGELYSRVRLRDGRVVEVSFAAVPGRPLTAASFNILENGGRRRFDAAARAAKLSPRERQVAALAARGLANKEIAREMAISKDTVKEYLSKAYHKTRTDGRAALIAYLYGG